MSPIRVTFTVTVSMPVAPAAGGACLLSWLPWRLKQTPPLAIGLAPGHGLDLAPVATLAGAVGSVAAFAHNTFQAPLLGHAQQRQPVVKGFGQRDRWAAETFEEDLQALLAPFAHTATMLAGPNVT
jgi:hypothetical protein